MGKDVFSRTTYDSTKSKATQGGTKTATHAAEARLRSGEGLDALVDPKGPGHLGPVRRSLPRFDKDGNFWRLTVGLPMAEETLLDTTGSMGSNVDKAFEVLPNAYEMITSGDRPILGRYDPQIATAIFNDVEDNLRASIPVLARSQFEMAEKIAEQMTLLTPGRGGCGNGKEDPQFGLFGAAYLTDAAINRWGLQYYHFTVSDEPIVDSVDLGWLRQIFGDDVLNRAKENGNGFSEGTLPDTAQVISDLQRRAHAFFLQVGDRRDVTRQWAELYGKEHFVMLINGTEHLHHVKAVIIGLIEGVLDLGSAEAFLKDHGVSRETAGQIVRSVAHIPLAAQTQHPNFGKIPMAGDLFREKTDLWPINPDEVPAASGDTDKADGKAEGAGWL